MTATDEAPDAVTGLQDLTSRLVQRVVDICLVLLILKSYAS
jgi:hypothetical protein